MDITNLRVIAFISGNRIHISKAASSASNESVVQFLGYFNNSQQGCPDIEIALTKFGLDVMEFKVSSKTPDNESAVIIPGIFTANCMLNDLIHKNEKRCGTQM